MLRDGPGANTVIQFNIMRIIRTFVTFSISYNINSLRNPLPRR